ncbi:MAG TPA: relaxase [Devosia sp.]|jgi:hypothetical protein|uniref:relaxase/mobilization nuclease domain-containing protein n=1 Tax=Devosia sp. TaxID=1871048 RepID=UPI002DDDBB98|nr:relaxase [Devosia sp.]HEV2517201.1 relaxase [Devosia sp.]
MMLKGSQRAGGKDLALHLMRRDQNEHVEVHSLRGFVSSNLVGAFREAFAISRGTRCKQYLFSLSFNPPPEASVSKESFIGAIERAEARLGLIGHPRAIVFHEKFGRRHAHCVWSRINPATMKATPLSHFKLRLQDMSRELFLENNWTLPRGFVRRSERNPFNFTRDEWQQTLRSGQDAAEVKRIFQDCWAISDSLPAFRSAMEARGYYLAAGERPVAVDWLGKVYSLSRWCGVHTVALTAKLGDCSSLPLLAEVVTALNEKHAAKIENFKSDIRQEFAFARDGLRARRDHMVHTHRQARARLDERQDARRQRELQARAKRFRRGLLGLWDRITGRAARTRALNERELAESLLRDTIERETLVAAQLSERRGLQNEMRLIAANKRLEQRTLLAPTLEVPQARTERGRRRSNRRQSRSP